MQTTQEMVRRACTGIEAVSLAVNVFILGTSLWVRTVPTAKHHTQRVSYTIIMWAVAMQMGYDIDRLILYSGDDSRFNVRPASCATGMYFFLSQLHITNFLITCIAVNLMLIVCFGVNPIEKKLLRWYVGVSIALGAFIPIIPAALGHFGPDPLYRLCYLTPLEPTERMRVVVLDVVLWELLAIVVASLSMIAVLITLFRSGRSTARALIRGNPMNAQLSTSSGSAPSGKSVRRRSSSTWRSLGVCFGRSRKEETESGLQPLQSMHTLQDQFLGIALKISLYPIFLIIANVVISVADLYFNYTLRNGVTSVAFLAVYQILYAGRGFCFAILCIFVDPSFQAGVKAAWHAQRDERMHALGRPPMAVLGGAVPDHMSFGQFLGSVPETSSDALNPPTDGSRRGSAATVDLSSALTSLPYTAEHGVPPLDTPPDESVSAYLRMPKSPTRSQHFTRSFAGVTSGSLPTGLSDDVDVDLRLSYAPSPTRSTFSPTRSTFSPTRSTFSRDTGPLAEGVSELDESMLDEKTDAEVATEAATEAEVQAQGHAAHALLQARRSSEMLQPGRRGEVRASAEVRPARHREGWSSGVDAKRRFEELGRQL